MPTTPLTLVTISSMPLKFGSTCSSCFLNRLSAMKRVNPSWMKPVRISELSDQIGDGYLELDDQQACGINHARC